MPVARVVAVALVPLDAVGSEAEAAKSVAEAEVVDAASEVAAEMTTLLSVELVEAGVSLASDVTVVPAVAVDIALSSPALIMFGQANIAERNSSLTWWHDPDPSLA